MTDDDEDSEDEEEEVVVVDTGGLDYGSDTSSDDDLPLSYSALSRSRSIEGAGAERGAEESSTLLSLDVIWEREQEGAEVGYGSSYKAAMQSQSGNVEEEEEEELYLDPSAPPLPCEAPLSRVGVARHRAR